MRRCCEYFFIFLMMRFIDLLWDLNHEMAVKNGYIVRDAHANIVAVLVCGRCLDFAVREKSMRRSTRWLSRHSRDKRLDITCFFGSQFVASHEGISWGQLCLSLS